MENGCIHIQPGYRSRVPPPGSVPHPLALFIIASVALHGLVLALPGSPPTPGHGQNFTASQLEVSLTNEPQQEHASPHPQNQAHRHHPANPSRLIAASQLHKRHASLHKRINTVQASQQTQQWFSAPVDEMTPPATGNVATRQSLNSIAPASQTTAPDPSAVALLLRQALLKHFRYPPVARQNAWQGKVVLSVLVDANGRVGHARVLRPSHYAILDRAARRAANSIGRIPAARPLLAGQSQYFRVPVAYRLQRE